MPDPSIARFRRVVTSAYAHLEERRQEVNDLNVFPVADGDTGDNMAMTMRAVMEELDRLDGLEVDEVGRTELVQALARAAVMGAGFGWLAIRRHGIYFAMVTLALAQMVYFVAVEVKFTGGEDGIQAVPRGLLFGLIDLRNEMAMYVVVLVIFLAGFVFLGVAQLIFSRFDGRFADKL